MIDIIPAILTNDPVELEKKIKLLEGVVDKVQVDIVDGVFADNKTIELEALAEVETGLLVDIHLMTNDPASWVEKSMRVMPDRLIGQIEKMASQEDFVFGPAAMSGIKMGLALDLETPVSALDRIISLPSLDVVLVMAVKAGFGGQTFQASALEKVKELGRIRSKENLLFKICVDGGVGVQNIRHIAEAGADEVVVGKSLFEGDIASNLNKLLEALVPSP